MGFNLGHAISSGIQHIGGEIKKVVMGPTGAAATAVKTALAGASGNQAPQDTTQEDIRKAQQKQYEDFQAQRPALERGLQTTAQQQTRTGLAQGIQQQRESAQGRGLLYSGKRMAGESAMRGQAGLNLAKQQQAIGTQLGQMGEKIRSGAIGTGFDIITAKQQLADTVYQQALANYRNKQGQAAALGSTAGGILGAVSPV